MCVCVWGGVIDKTLQSSVHCCGLSVVLAVGVLVLISCVGCGWSSMGRCCDLSVMLAVRVVVLICRVGFFAAIDETSNQ